MLILFSKTIFAEDKKVEGPCSVSFNKRTPLDGLSCLRREDNFLVVLECASKDPCKLVYDEKKTKWLNKSRCLIHEPTRPAASSNKESDKENLSAQIYKHFAGTSENKNEFNVNEKFKIIKVKNVYELQDVSGNKVSWDLLPSEDIRNCLEPESVSENNQLPITMPNQSGRPASTPPDISQQSLGD